MSLGGIIAVVQGKFKFVAGQFKLRENEGEKELGMGGQVGRSDGVL